MNPADETLTSPEAIRLLAARRGQIVAARDLAGRGTAIGAMLGIVADKYRIAVCLLDNGLPVSLLRRSLAGLADPHACYDQWPEQIAFMEINGVLRGTPDADAIQAANAAEAIAEAVFRQGAPAMNPNWAQFRDDGWVVEIREPDTIMITGPRGPRIATSLPGVLGMVRLVESAVSWWAEHQHQPDPDLVDAQIVEGSVYSGQGDVVHFVEGALGFDLSGWQRHCLREAFRECPDCHHWIHSAPWLDEATPCPTPDCRCTG